MVTLYYKDLLWLSIRTKDLFLALGHLTTFPIIWYIIWQNEWLYEMLLKLYYFKKHKFEVGSIMRWMVHHRSKTDWYKNCFLGFHSNGKCLMLQQYKNWSRLPAQILLQDFHDNNCWCSRCFSLTSTRTLWCLISIKYYCENYAIFLIASFLQQIQN